ncbi:hypothetical protein HHK36_024728 [Tetracentron sinense]|uniref:ZF-HD dimerization-type domain-containing protein n=1 Tax=Tetracentron sinense TaxID=13715 RepID=A0A834YNN0_TETSI|nr:hypothetical protein HHK36_024728 [Tetracentron sinense]
MPASGFSSVSPSEEFENDPTEFGEDTGELGFCSMKKRQVGSKRSEEPSRSSGTSSFTIRNVRYGECQKNHAAKIGGYAVDGCREFMASGEEGTSGALKCAACGCHRNFHRREVETEIVVVVLLVDERDSSKYNEERPQPDTLKRKLDDFGGREGGREDEDEMKISYHQRKPRGFPLKMFLPYI